MFNTNTIPATGLTLVATLMLLCGTSLTGYIGVSITFCSILLYIVAIAVSVFDKTSMSRKVYRHRSH